MGTYFTSVLLAFTLIAPNLPAPLPELSDVSEQVPADIAISAPGAKDQPATSAAIATGTDNHILLETPPLSIEEYAGRMAGEADIDRAKFRRLIVCESRGKHEAVGDNGTSFGILQFKNATFAHFSRKYGMTDADIENPYHQIDLAVRMISNGRLGHWKNCSRKIGWSAAQVATLP